MFISLKMRNNFGQ